MASKEKSLNISSINSTDSKCIGTNGFGKWLALTVTSCCLSLLFFNFSSVPVALTTIQSNLHFSSDNFEWIINTYLLSLAVLILPAGRLADLIGFRFLFCSGFVLFALGSLICGFSFSPTQLILGRVIQGMGGAAMFPPMGAYLISTFPNGQRGKAIGINVGIGSIFMMLGPMIGGTITEYFSWRYLFLINLPIAFFGFCMTLKIVPLKTTSDVPNDKREFDYLGALLIALSIGSITISLMEGAKWGWGSFPTLLLLFSAAFFLILFLITYKKFSEPIVDLSLFKQPIFTGATFCGCLAQLITMVTVFWTIYFQQSLGFCPITSGWAIVLTNFPPIFIAPYGGHLADSLGVKIPVTIGFCLLIFALGWINFFSDSISISQLLPAFFSFGFGLSLVMSPSYVASIEEIPDEKRAAASSLSLALRQLAPTFGMAILSAFYLTLLEAEKPSLTAFKVINLICTFIACIGIFIALFFLPSRKRSLKKFRNS